MVSEHETPNIDGSLDHDWVAGFVSCAMCGECDLAYMGEHYDDDQHLGSCYKCANCGHWSYPNEDEE